jgi:hypothetical protein
MENFFIIARNKEKTALDRINELLSSSYTPKIIKDKGIANYTNTLISDTDLA